MVEWLELSPCNKKISNPAFLWRVCMFPPCLQGSLCVLVSWSFVCLCWPMINHQPINGVPLYSTKYRLKIICNSLYCVFIYVLHSIPPFLGITDALKTVALRGLDPWSPPLMLQHKEVNSVKSIVPNYSVRRSQSVEKGSWYRNWKTGMANDEAAVRRDLHTYCCWLPDEFSHH